MASTDLDSSGHLDSSGPTSRIYFSQRLRLHYVDWGNPTAPPLLLVHGGRDHCRNWDWVAAALRRDWHVLAPDLRGHGDSQWSPDGNYSTARLRLRPGAADPPAGAGAGHDRRAFARRQHRDPLYRGLSRLRCASSSRSRGSGRRRDRWRRAPPSRSPTACANGSTSSARSPGGCRGATRRSRMR